MLIIYFLMLFCLLFSSLSQISGFGAAFPSFFQLLSLLLKIIVFFFSRYNRLYSDTGHGTRRSSSSISRTHAGVVDCPLPIGRQPVTANGRLRHCLCPPIVLTFGKTILPATAALTGPGQPVTSSSSSLFSILSKRECHSLVSPAGRGCKTLEFAGNRKEENHNLPSYVLGAKGKKTLSYLLPIAGSSSFRFILVVHYPKPL